MKTIKSLASVLLFVVAACDNDVGDLNNPGLDDLLSDPQPSELNSAATGLLVGTRRDMPQPNGYIIHLGILGREAYNFDAADPRFVEEMLAGPALSAASPAFGGNFWLNPYRNIRNALIVLAAADSIADADYSMANKEALRGFTKTIMALDYLVLINTRDTNGIFIVGSLNVDELAPKAEKPAALEKISTLLDEGKTHLAAAGMTFPFPLSSGFAGFDTPANFLKVNRALKARVEAYRGNHAAVLTALGESFISADAMNPRLTLGVYHAFGTGSGDTLNGLLSSNIFAHPSIVTDAEKNGDTVDARVTAKIRTVTEGMQQMHKSDKAFTMYQSITSPIPIIRNEELILLRAEANIGMAKFDDAETDINFIRVQSGGLMPRNDLSASNAEDELLKQRRYSLLFEGHRWIDVRRFNKLSTLPVDVAGDKVHAAFPIPQPEQDARQ